MANPNLTMASTPSSNPKLTSDWDRNDVPSSRKKKFIENALAVLRLIEGPAQYHPIANAVVKTIITIVILAQEREENDQRVGAVLYAKADMLRALANITQLKIVLLSESTKRSLDQFFKDTHIDVKECGNMLDMYAKEHRLVRYVKAREWKDTLKTFINKFETRKNELHFIMSLGTASGVDSLHAKMDVILQAVEQPYEWEHNIRSCLKNLNFEQIIDPDAIRSMSDSNLAQLIDSTDDPRIKGLDLNLHISTMDGDSDQRRRLTETLLRDIREEIVTPLEDLFKHNEQVFEAKLNIQTKQIELAIDRAQKAIEKKLSGLSGRLHNGDLRTIWEEMGWTFCVENKYFAIALFEYYLDKFSVDEDARTQPPTIAVTPSSQGRLVLSTFAQQRHRIKHVNFTHPDAWTLRYLLDFNKICQAVDTDDSGFIRISEANKFTDEGEAFGMALPQWCAYCAVGWYYELQVYQTRIQSLMDLLIVLQLTGLPENRRYLSHIIGGYLLTDLSSLAGGAVEDCGLMIDQLKDLVNNKIYDQDHIMRAELHALRYSIDAYDTLKLLCGERPFESVLMQLVTLVLEHCVKIFYSAREHILDYREFGRLEKNFARLRQAAIDHMVAMEDGFSPNSKLSPGYGANNFFQSYYGGIFRLLTLRREAQENPEFPKWIYKDIHQQLVRSQIADDYPCSLPLMNDESVLHYPTWETYMKSLANNEIPPGIPRVFDMHLNTYSVPHFKLNTTGDREVYPGQLHSCAFCDSCNDGPIDGLMCYMCVDCRDFSLCETCQQENETALYHPPDHVVFRHCKDYNPYENYLMKGLAAYRLKLHQDQEALLFGHEIQCCECASIIPTTATLYQCLEIPCHRGYICQKCTVSSIGELVDIFPFNFPLHSEHEWWHTLIVIPGQRRAKIVTGGYCETFMLAKGEVSDGNNSVSAPPISDMAVDVASMKDEIVNLKERLERIESMVEQQSITMEESFKTLLQVLGGPRGDN